MKTTENTILVPASASSWLRSVKFVGNNIAMVTKLAQVKSRRDYRVTYPFYCTKDMFEAFKGEASEAFAKGESIGRAFNEWIGRLQRTDEAAEAINKFKQATA